MPSRGATEISFKEQYLIFREVTSSRTMTFSYSIRECNPLFARTDAAGWRRVMAGKSVSYPYFTFNPHTQQVSTKS